jgi:precorrin-4 C11-methyltransferase
MVVARLHSGDPSLYGAIAEQINIVQQTDIAYEIIPGVSSAFAAAAACQIEYTVPGITQTLILTRRAGRTPVPEKESLASLAKHQASMAIFLSAGMIDETVADLLAGGYEKDTPAVVVYRASWPDQQCIRGTLATIAAGVQQAGITEHALILVGEAVDSRGSERSQLYCPDFSHSFRTAQGQRANRTAIVAITRRGWHTGMRVLQVLDDADLFLPDRFMPEAHDARAYFYKDMRTQVQKAFSSHERIVLIMAAGIAVRMIAPLLRSKWHDPAVVAMDDGGRNVISLLAGHWGGGNELARKIAHAIGGNPVITTESDLMGFPAVDLLIKAVTRGSRPDNPARIREIQSAILENRRVGFYPAALRLFPGMEGHPSLQFYDRLEALFQSACSTGLAVTHSAELCNLPQDEFLVIHPRDIVVGIGCHRSITQDELARGIQIVLAEHNLTAASIAMLTTISARQEERGLHAYAQELDLPILFFTPEEISRVAAPSPESQHALQAFGVHGVAEPCALLAAGTDRLLAPKTKFDNMTVALAAIPLQRLLQEPQE